VFGFTVRLFVVYSDGIGVSVGETRDTIKARLAMEKGEHIGGVTPILTKLIELGSACLQDCISLQKQYRMDRLEL
jgi:hypothetical protein